jgi:hypothetical protein
MPCMVERIIAQRKYCGLPHARGIKFLPRVPTQYRHPRFPEPRLLVSLLIKALGTRGCLTCPC